MVTINKEIVAANAKLLVDAEDEKYYYIKTNKSVIEYTESISSGISVRKITIINYNNNSHTRFLLQTEPIPNYLGLDKPVIFYMNIMDEKTKNKLDWLVNYVTEEGFTEKHLEALCHITGLFNDSEESEKEIFDFSDQLYKKYAE